MSGLEPARKNARVKSFDILAAVRCGATHARKIPIFGKGYCDAVGVMSVKCLDETSDSFLDWNRLGRRGMLARG
jgi:hypothetical protein